MGKTVAFPVVGIGLDANPLKRGLADAKASVAQTVAGIKMSAAELAKAKFVTAFADRLKPGDYNLKNTVKDLAAHYGKEIQTRFAEVKTKFSESQTGKDLINDFGAFWAQITAVANRVRSSAIGRGLEGFATGSVKGVGVFARGSGLSALVGGAGAALVPSLKVAAGGLWSGAKYGVGIAGTGISKLANIPETLSKAALPLNQTLELAGKAQRLLGAPIRSMMNWEANNNQAVWEGGKSALNDKGWSGTLQRFEVGVESMFSNILNALDKTFNFKGWIEAARGAMDGVSRIIESVFGSLDQASSGSDNMEEMFMAGQDVAIDLSQQMVEFLSQIYNSSLDAYEQLIYIYNALMHPFSDSAFYKSLHQGLSDAGLRDRQGNKIGRIDIDKDVGGFFKGIRENLNYDRMLNEMFGIKNMELEPSKKAQAEARKSLEDMAAGFRNGSDQIAQAQTTYAQSLDQIRILENQGGAAVRGQANAARDAADRARAQSVLGAIQPFIAMQAQARESKALEGNSDDLISAIYRAQNLPEQDFKQQQLDAMKAYGEQQKLTNQKLDSMISVLKMPQAQGFAIGGIPG